MTLLEWLFSSRWFFAIFLLPISFVYDIFWILRNKYIYWKGSAPGLHNQRVLSVQRQVKDWKRSGDKRQMCTARPAWLSISQQKLLYKDKCYKIYVNLMDILEINVQKGYVRCEPLVSMEQLISTLVPLGWTVPIVPEIGHLTVGGLVMGGGIESTSHKYGLWQFICISYEMVLSDGSLIEATKDNEHSDLFYAIPWSYGTLGFLTAVNLKIIPFKKYIKLQYRPVSSFNKISEVLEEEIEKNVDSIEGILFTKTSGVIMSGSFTNDIPSSAKINSIGRWYKPWFYKHVATFCESQGIKEEIIPTVDFYFRHNKPYYWLSHIYIPFGHNVIFRYLFGWMLPYNYGLLKLIREYCLPEGVIDNFVLQDYGISISNLGKALEFFHKTVNVYPIWLCPARHMDTGPIASKKHENPIMIDIGLYGYSPLTNYDSDAGIHAMEQYVLRDDGYIGLYAETLLSLEDFRKMFDGSLYEKMRNSIPYCNEAFPTVYEKISRIGRRK